MTDADSLDPAFRARLDEAGRWRARLAMAGVSATPAFEAWMAADPENARAWRASRPSWEVFETAAGDPQLAAALADARASARQELARRRVAAAALRWVAVLAVVVVLGWGAALHRPAQIYETPAGARRQIVLTDGSSVRLDADSRLKVRFGGDRRDLQLVRGQAAFDVAHDARRPFAVEAGDRRIVALGTRFNVDLLGPTTRVTLVEGRVRVEQLSRSPMARLSGRPGPAVSLDPGQQLVAASGAASTTRVTQVDTANALAWTGGQLVFQDERLADVAARVSRYSPTKVAVADPLLAERRISGMFIAGDMVTFLDAVRQHLSAEAVEVAPGRLELRRGPA